MKILILLVVFYMSTIGLRQNLDSQFSIYEAKSVFIPPPANIKYMSFGFDELVANSLWLRWIQNIDSCGKDMVKRDDALPPKENLDENLLKSQKEMVCDQGWAFRMLDAVTDLSPKFRMPYALGASTLSIISEDHIGAQKIYEKGFLAYPKDWKILYRGAYLYLFELNELERGAELLKLAADNGAPDWLYFFSSRIYTQAGRAKFGIKVLKDQITELSDPGQIEEYQDRIKELEATIK